MQEQNIAQMLENPFMQYNHIEIVSVTSDSAVMSLDIRRHHQHLRLRAWRRIFHHGRLLCRADCPL